MTPVTVVAVGDTADSAIAALEGSGGPVTVVRRCPELAGLLAACQSGLAQVAVVATGTEGLTATLVDRLTAVGVSVVAVAATTTEAARLHSVGAWTIGAGATAGQLTESVLAAVSARRHHRSASFGFPLAAPLSPGSSGPPSDTGHRTPAVRSPGAAAQEPNPGTRQTARSGMGEDGTTEDAAGLNGTATGRHGRAAGGRGPEAGARERPAGVVSPFAQDVPNGGSPQDGTGGTRSDRGRDGREGDARTKGAAAAPVKRPGEDPSGGGLPAVASRVTAAVPGGTSLFRRRGARLVGHSGARAVEAQRPGRRRGRAQGVQEDGSGAVGGSSAPRTLAVWGPIGSPGRTLVAVNMAGELAAQGRRVMLIDADSYGASVAASLGLLDESASFAQACRVADQGLLTVGELARISSDVVCAFGTFSLLTGLTRSDRWPELRAAAVERVLDAALSLVDTVVVDCGFCLETDEELSYDTVAPRRNAATLAALGKADTVYAVGSADAVGMPRLIRALADLPESCAGADIQVVLNKVRKRAAGGSPVKALEEAWRRFGPALPISHVLPWEPDVPAQALLEGRLLQELSPDSPLRRAIRDLCCAFVQGNPRMVVSSATARPGNPG